ncbi:MAG: adenylate/guanylate cyclase domain-containing protein [Alphaproteobacteria bacterium]|jgi:adenylate cyclase|nr:adenylate/guanylate cyclase domain-containing protein [Alphaproteobacteria bacterium]
MDTLEPVRPPEEDRRPLISVWSPTPVIEWLILEGWRINSIPELVEALAEKLLEDGVPAWRTFVLIPQLHPLYVGAGYRWVRGAGEVARRFGEHGIRDQAIFSANPLKLVIVDGYGAVRRRLDDGYKRGEFPLLDELQDEGGTDYVCIPIDFANGDRTAVSFATDHPDGFDTTHLQQFNDLAPLLGRLIEREALRNTAENLLNTYVGHHAGQRILQGQIRRGSGDTIFAAIWYCDLRNFTALSEALPRDSLLALLNGFFDAMATPVHNHRGQVLKFMGDGLLAIFPVDGDCAAMPNACPLDEACGRALDAAAEAEVNMQALNDERVAEGAAPLDYGVALHVGEVMYGNIGAADRLDFTVIGPAVNLSQRIEQLCKTLGRRPLLSKAFAEACRRPTESLGKHDLRGVTGLHDIYAVPPDR